MAAGFAVVDIEIFRSRLIALEEWLWSEYWTTALRSPPALEEVVSGVERLSDLYTIERRMIHRAGDAGLLPARLLYFLAADAPKVYFVIRELEARGLGGGADCLSVLDMGCGVGATAAGLILSLDCARHREVHLKGIDAVAAGLAAFQTVCGKCGELAGLSVKTEVLAGTIGDRHGADRDSAADVVLAQTVLNEVAVESSESAFECFRRWASRSLTIAIEPALKEPTRRLQAWRDRCLAFGIRIHAPCPHEAPCPMLANSKDWCHEMRPFDPTPRVSEIQRHTGRRDRMLKYSFMAMGPGSEVTTEAAAKMSRSAAALTGRFVTEPLGSKGKTERIVCTTEGKLVTLRVLDRERSAGNEALLSCSRGVMVEVDQSPRIGPEGHVTVMTP